jgi:hypothetical protein
LGTYQKEEDYADEHFDDLKERKVFRKSEVVQQSTDVS